MAKMNKELQDLAWSVLPKEFKEEVKKRYNLAMRHRDLYSARGAIEALELLFGRHNLTSDAEGEEDEMLYVSRKKLQYFYESLRKVGKNHAAFVLRSLFGSKCLPDDGDNLSPEPKPAEPKYHIGQRVRHIPTMLVDVIDGISQSAPYIYHFKHMVDPINGQGIFESDLEPYTEPEEDHIVQDHEMVDRLIKDGFRDERRLNIAAQMMQGLICAPLIPGCNPNPPAEQLAKTAFRLADAFIAEAEKGGKA